MVGVMREGTGGRKKCTCSDTEACQEWFLCTWSLRHLYNVSCYITLCMPSVAFTLSFIQIDILHESKVTDVILYFFVYVKHCMCFMG